MAIDLITGKTGSIAELMGESEKRRWKKWNDLLKEGFARMHLARRNNVRITPTRFYKLVYEREPFGYLLNVK